MTSEFTLQLLVAGAVAYQFIIVTVLGIWLWRDGIRVPSTIEITTETITERRRVAAVGILFWFAVCAIIISI